MKKKILAFFLASIMTCLVVACGNKPVEKEQNPVDMSAVCGEWRESVEKDPLMIINEDYTCVYLGENCTWELKEYSEELKGYFLNVIKENGDKNSVLVSENSYLDKECWRLYIEETDGYGYRFSSIEITADNFFDYFENCEHASWMADAFGDITSLNYTYCIRLKDEYYKSLDYEKSEVALEISPKYATYYYKIDVENEVWEKEVLDNTESEAKKEIYSLENVGLIDDFEFYGAVLGGVSQCKEDTEIMDISSYDIARVKGKLIFIE